MIVGPTITLEEDDMDAQQNQVQEIPMTVVDTGPHPFDVLQARMTLQERELMDRMDSLRRDLQEGALELPAARLAQLTDSLRLLDARLSTVRQLRGGW